MNGLRVLVAEDHLELRGVVVGILSAEFDVVEAVGDGEELILAAIRQKPDVIVADVAMPFMDGPSARKELLSHGVKYPFVFMTILDLPPIPPEADEPQIAYVHKNDMVSELNLAVWAVAAGNTYISRLFRGQ